MKTAHEYKACPSKEQHKFSHELANSYSFIAYEELEIPNLDAPNLQLRADVI